VSLIATLWGRRGEDNWSAVYEKAGPDDPVSVDAVERQNYTRLAERSWRSTALAPVTLEIGIGIKKT
jgi:hypothetical protein